MVNARVCKDYPGPLPEEQVYFEYDGDEEKAPTEVVVADSHNWFEELTDEQLEAISEIVGLDLNAARNYSPEPEKEDGVHIIELSKQPITAGGESIILEDTFDNLPEDTFYPALVWNGGLGISVVHKDADVLVFAQNQRRTP